MAAQLGYRYRLLATPPLCYHRTLLPEIIQQTHGDPLHESWCKVLHGL